MDNAAQLNPVIQQWFNLGHEQLRTGQWAEAESTYRRILAQRTDDPEVHHHFGIALKAQGKLPEAITALRAAVALRPDFPEAFNTLGEALRDANQPDQSKEAFRRALELRPNFPEVYFNLALLMQKLNRPLAAIEGYRRALALRPDDAQAWNNLGNILWRTDQLTESIQAFRRTLALLPHQAPGWNNLALALKDTGRLDEALTCFERAMAIEPKDAAVHSNRLHTLHYHAGFDAAAIFHAVRRWNHQFASPVAGEIPIHDNDPDPNRRIRVGYVSPDFREHCVAMFIMPLLSRHDHSLLEVFCYSNFPVADAVTARFQNHADHWRNIAGMIDQQVAKIIHQDKIDILVDLALHTAGNRLMVFARKPAPIQVTWLGYPGTTGLDAIDYRLTDPRLDPVDSGEIRNPKSEVAKCPSRLAQIRINDQIPNVPMPKNVSDSHGPLSHCDIGSLGFGSDFGFRASDFSTQEPYYSERSLRLPDTFWCYDPRGAEQNPNPVFPQPSPLPALAVGHVTFGGLSNFCKVTDRTLELWAGVLAAAPSARLLMVAPVGPSRDHVVKKLGVAPQRVEFVAYQPRRKYLELFSRIDLCLDTLPCNGGTTSLEALWMGVPVLTRVGETVAGRAGWSLLHNLGLTELVAHTDDQFVKIAAELVGNLDRLDRLRANLRARMEQSPLMDGARFARNMEAAYRQMWQAWCSTRRCSQ